MGLSIKCLWSFREAICQHPDATQSDRRVLTIHPQMDMKYKYLPFHIYNFNSFRFDLSDQLKHFFLFLGRHFNGKIWRSRQTNQVYFPSTYPSPLFTQLSSFCSMSFILRKFHKAESSSSASGDLSHPAFGLSSMAAFC